MAISVGPPHLQRRGPAGDLSFILLGAAARLKAGRGVRDQWEGGGVCGLTASLHTQRLGDRSNLLHHRRGASVKTTTAGAMPYNRKDHGNRLLEPSSRARRCSKAFAWGPPARLRCRPHFMDETGAEGGSVTHPGSKDSAQPTCGVHFTPWMEWLKLGSSRARWRLTRAPRLGCQPPLGSSRWKNNCGVGPGLLAGPRAPPPCTRGAKQPAGEPWGGPGGRGGAWTGHLLRIQGGKGAPSRMWSGEGVSRLAQQRPLPASLLQPVGTDQNTNGVLLRTHFLPAGPVLGLTRGVQTPTSTPTPVLPGREAERAWLFLAP